MSEKLRLFEMFAGYGGASFSLKKAGIEFETVGFSEIDKYAIQCYEQNHVNMVDDNTGEEYCDSVKLPEKIQNFGDCTKINPNDIPDFDLLTGGFPCQSFSIAGKGLGELDTRGTLFNEIIRIAEVKQPKFMLLENVKGLMSKKHEETFCKILTELVRIGYIVKTKVLNSKEYGIPQNRERIWFVCCRKDIPFYFDWPAKEELKIFLKDILEDEVDEKYYLSNKAIDRILVRSNSGKLDDLNGSAKCVTACNNYKGGRQANIVQVGMIKQICVKRSNDTPKEINEFLRQYKLSYTLQEIADYLDIPKTQVEHYFRIDNSRAIPSPKIWNKLKEILKFDNTYDKQVLEVYEKEITFESTRRVYSEEGCSPCISSTNADKIIQIKNATKKGYLEARQGDCINLEQPNSKTRRARVQEQSIGCLQTNDQRGVVTSDMRIRKLTPTECFRLMGFLNDEINLDGLSNTQRYKLAGNGWELSVVSKIFKNMFVTAKHLYTN